MLILKDPAVWLKNLFIDAGLGYSLSAVLSAATLVLVVILMSWLANLITKAAIRKIVLRIIKRSKSKWDDIFYEQKVFTRLSHFAPALVIFFLSGWTIKNSFFWLSLVHNLTYIYMLCIGMIVLLSFVEAWHKIYQTLPISRHRNITGYVQLVRILLILITILVIVSVVFRKDISTVVAGLGAMAAVLILVFKDTILGFVGSVQLSANKMLKVGDWITMPGREVDGVVTDITLNTVKVQNFDMTIITVPTYALVSESFQNWVGMEESGVRRIRRPIFIDMRSVKFADENLRSGIFSMPLMKNYPGDRTTSRQGDKTADHSASFSEINRVTNLGLFRYYAEQYLAAHPLIDKANPVMVRHRDPEGNGLPVQVYAFASNNALIPYENIQSEVIEHLLAILGEFDLKVYQHPTGDDILQLKN